MSIAFEPRSRPREKIYTLLKISLDKRPRKIYNFSVKSLQKVHNVNYSLQKTEEK